jgi:hypothetical protein
VSLNDLHQFDLVTLKWKQLDLDVNGFAPSPRFSFGFTAVGQVLYVFGGQDSQQNGNYLT